MAPHSSTFAWKIPWMEEPGGLQSMGSLRVGHDWATSLSLFTFMHWRRKWQPTPVFLSGESQGQRAWWAAVYGVSLSQTRLKQLSSSSITMWCSHLMNWELYSPFWHKIKSFLYLFLPYMAAHQAPSSLGFSRQEHWSGLPFPSSMHEGEKRKWSRSVVSDS